MNYMLAVFISLFVTITHAEEIVSNQCKAIPVEGELLTLSVQKQQLVFIHNTSNTDLWMTHPVAHPSASAGWTSRLQAGNWSALAIDKKSFALSCIESKPGHEQQVPCTGVISACIWPNVAIPSKKSGTFWAGEDMSLSALTAHLGGRGFELP